jgi:enamine deaminase RidA (YjgF/YER057c/UK114 family)
LPPLEEPQRDGKPLALDAKKYANAIAGEIASVKPPMPITDFREHPKVADGASDLLEKVFGKDKLSTRVVLGVASLPLGMPVELELVLEVEAGKL